MIFRDYHVQGFYDESDGLPRKGLEPLIDAINELPTKDLLYRQKAAEEEMMKLGITFDVYKDSQSTERIFPFDIIPRVVEADVWERVSQGLKQRIEALALFIQDVYNDQKIFKDRVVDRQLIEGADGYRKQCLGFTPPQILFGREIYVQPGGLTRVALRKGSLVVNSSQGGGSKDTWVLSSMREGE